MELSILKMKLKNIIKNEKMREITNNAIDVGYRVKKPKFKYAGPVMGMKGERWVKWVMD